MAPRLPTELREAARQIALQISQDAEARLASFVEFYNILIRVHGPSLPPFGLAHTYFDESTLQTLRDLVIVRSGSRVPGCLAKLENKVNRRVEWARIFLADLTRACRSWIAQDFSMELCDHRASGTAFRSDFLHRSHSKNY